MAFEVLWEVAKMLLWLAVFMLPPVYLLDGIRKKVQPEKAIQNIAVLFGLSLLLVMAFYPFFADLMEYSLALQGYDVDLLLFNSDLATYIVVLMVIALIYLVVFNRYK